MPELAPATIPAGRMVELPGRGTTYVTDSPGRAPDAPALVLLHALGCTGLLTWFPAIETLRAEFRVITLDQRWHGRGIRPDTFRLEDCADDVAALLDVLGLDDALVAGYSMGSIIAQRVWRQHPDRVRGLVLAASTDRLQVAPYERAFFAALTAASAAGSLVPRRAVEALAPDPGEDGASSRLLAGPALDRWALAEFHRTPTTGILRALTALGGHHSRPWLGEIDVPTAVVVMAHDRVIPTSRQAHLVARIPGARAHVVPEGHAGCVLGAARFVPVFARAVSETQARTRPYPVP